VRSGEFASTRVLQLNPGNADQIGEESSADSSSNGDESIVSI